MRKLLILISILVIPAKAYALTIIPVDYTGNVAQRIDSCGYGCGGGSTGGYIGGPAANNSLGGAFQFTIDHPVDIDYLLASAHVRNYSVPDGQTDGMEFYFKLYSGTLNTYQGEPSLPYPAIGTFSLSAPMDVSTSTADVDIPELGAWHTFTRDGYYTDVPLPFDIRLQPGTYWIARERNSGQDGPIVDHISVEFASRCPSIPESATRLLWGPGLVGIFLRKRPA